MAADHRSAHPDIPGVPWWGAVLIAVTATAGRLRDRRRLRHQELTIVFAALYVIGCVAAVLAVRQSGIFTAVIQPPLILFVAVPTAYFLFHGAKIAGIKDILINCGYPLIERFPLMFITSVVVLLIGMARWYFGAGDRAGKATPKAGAAVGAGLVAGIAAKVTSLLNRRTADDADDVDPEVAEPVRRPRKHTIDRPAAAARRPRERRTTKREAPNRSRHARPPLDDPDGPASAPRRRYANRHGRNADDAPGSPPPRRRRTPREPGVRSTKREYRPRECGADGTTGAAPVGRAAPPIRYDLYSGYDPPEPYAAPPPPSTHNPFSNVRYRGSADDEDDAPLSAAAARLISDGQVGFRAAARTPASRWRSSPAARCRSRSRRDARAPRAPAPRAPTRRT